MKLHADKGVGFFDKISNLTVLDLVFGRLILFFQLYLFGKSLTLSMLEQFHSIQYRDQYQELFKVCCTKSIAIVIEY